MVAGEPRKCRIGRIDTVNIGSHFSIEYYLQAGENNACVRKEYALFPTKEKLLKSL